MNFRDRIKSLRRVPASKLVPNPKNWRTHPERQRTALQGVLEEVGLANAVLARELPDGTLMMIDGHLRQELVTDQKIPVLVLDVTEEEADKLLVTIDPLAELAERNDEKLQELLGTIDAQDEAFRQFLADMQDLPMPTEEPGAGEEEPGTGGEGGGGLGNPIIKFELVFDDDAQQQAWYGFLRHLRTSYPDKETHGSRLARYIETLQLD